MISTIINTVIDEIKTLLGVLGDKSDTKKDKVEDVVSKAKKETTTTVSETIVPTMTFRLNDPYAYTSSITLLGKPKKGTVEFTYNGTDYWDDGNGKIYGERYYGMTRIDGNTKYYDKNGDVIRPVGSINYDNGDVKIILPSFKMTYGLDSCKFDV